MTTDEDTVTATETDTLQKTTIWLICRFIFILIAVFCEVTATHPER